MDWNPIYWIYIEVIVFALVAGGLGVFVFPFRSLIMNRWKLKIADMRGTGHSPVIIIYKNNMWREIVVDTSKETFTHDEAAYNIRSDKFYNWLGFKYSVYLHNNPEPLDLQIDEKKLTYFFTGTDKEGKPKTFEVPFQNLFKEPNGQYTAAKVIDGKTYDNLLIRMYQAGMAWAMRNKDATKILLFITIGLIILLGVLVYYQGSQTSNACTGALYNISAQIHSQVSTL